MFETHANLAYATVAVAPSPATSGTSLTLASGLGSLFPASNFSITIYPPLNPLVPVNPLHSNAEICLCTSRTGDVLTIVRAQQGTTAKSIATGWQVAATATAKAFTDIENSVIQFISAGTTKASASEIVFSNANNVTFGISGQTVTASVAATSGGGGGGVAISAPSSSQSTGTIVFSNSNGVSFGLNAGVLTASHNGITSQSVQPVAASASNGSFAFSTLGFSNANGVTFGTSGGSIVTASVAAGAAAGSIAAGGSTLALGQVVFSNSNGISFSLNGSTVTASHNALTSQSAQAASASNGSFTFQTLAFSNANNVTFGTSGGSIITASVATAAAGNSVNFSAGGASANLGSIVFSDANGVSFGLNGSTITASANAGTGGAGNGFQFVFVPVPWVPNNSTMSIAQQTVGFFDPFYLDSPISFNVIRSVHSYQGQGASSAVSTTGLNAWSQSFAVYSRSVTNSGATNFSNSSNWVTVFSSFQTTSAGWSASGSSQSINYGWQTDSTGGSSSISLSTNAAVGISMTVLSGSKMGNCFYNTSLPPGEYLAFFNMSSSTAGLGAVASNILYVTNLYFNPQVTNASWGTGFDGPLVDTAPVMPGNGNFTASLGTVPASINLNQIRFNGSRRYMIFSKA